MGEWEPDLVVEDESETAAVSLDTTDTAAVSRTREKQNVA